MYGSKGSRSLESAFYKSLVFLGLIVGFGVTMIGSWLAGYSVMQREFWGTVILAVGTGIVTAFSVSVLHNYYSESIKHEAGLLLDQVRSAGFRAVYREDDDPEYRKMLSGLIEKANETIIFAGIGLNILHHHAQLLDEIVHRADSNAGLRVKFLVADHRNKTLHARQREEIAGLQKDEVFVYDVDWFKSQAATLNRVSKTAKKGNVSFGQLNCLPMLSIVKVDNDYFFAPYGWGQSGRRSPRIHFVRGDGKSPMVRFLDNCLNAYEKDSHEYWERR